MARNTLQTKITADAVFASELQRSDEPSPSSIRKAVQAAMRSKEHGLRQPASISNTNIRRRDEMGALHPGQDSRLFHSPGSARSPGADPGGRMRSQPTSMPA